MWQGDVLFAILMARGRFVCHLGGKGGKGVPGKLYEKYHPYFLVCIIITQ